jgi:hypothetical protein
LLVPAAFGHILLATKPDSEVLELEIHDGWTSPLEMPTLVLL